MSGLSEVLSPPRTRDSQCSRSTHRHRPAHLPKNPMAPPASTNRNAVSRQPGWRQPQSSRFWWGSAVFDHLTSVLPCEFCHLLATADYGFGCAWDCSRCTLHSNVSGPAGGASPGEQRSGSGYRNWCDRGSLRVRLCCLSFSR